ncbi:MAG: NlpC/P60 family protein [Pseudomonadota bacterium]
MSPHAPTRARVVEEARTWLGTPYLHRASARGAGADCLGLVRGVWRGLYGVEPEPLAPYAPDWAEASRCETLALCAGRHLRAVPVAEALPGDVLLFRFRAHLPAKHAAILSAPGFMIHAYDGVAVCEGHLTPWWRRHLAHAFAFPGVE